MKISIAIHTAKQRLKKDNNLEAKLLLAYVLQKDYTYLHTWGEQELSMAQQNDFFALVAQCQQGRPVAYLLGSQEFWSLPLKVTEATLIPRADTETLIDVALEIIAKQPIKKVLDLGTGSGAIACALASTQSHLKLVATDIFEETLAVAQENAQTLGFKQIHFIQSDWFSKVNDSFDLVVSNPPYISEDDPHLQQLTDEPLPALVSGKDGLEAIRHIVLHGKNYLNHLGWLVLEHGFEQAAKVQKLLYSQGFVKVQTRKDLANNDRVTFGQLLTLKQE